jgi:broad specificity phosphatase PhoE
MLTVVLVRPGCTDYDQQGRIQGTLDIPLNEQGKQEVAKLVGELKSAGLEIVYSSPCETAQETADLVGKSLHLKVKTVEKLRNLDHGLWQGMLIEEVRTKQPKVYRQWQEHPECVCPPDGELVEQAQDRINEALQKLLRKHDDDKIAIVVPEPLATLVRSALTQTPATDLWEGLGSGATAEILEIEPQALAAML